MPCIVNCATGCFPLSAIEQYQRHANTRRRSRTMTSIQFRIDNRRQFLLIIHTLMLIAVLAFITVPSTLCHAFATSSLKTTTTNPIPAFDTLPPIPPPLVIPNDVKAAVIVPGFLTGADDFESLARILTEQHGIPTISVPMPNWHWLPCLGGRSMRPMLERIDYTVRHVAAAVEQQQRSGDGNESDDDVVDLSAIPPFSYTALDCALDFLSNPGGVLEVGGSAEVDEYPIVAPRGTFPPPRQAPVPPTPNGNDARTENDTPTRVILIGHSAGGWISRVYLTSSPYGGKSYAGSNHVHSLITLGTPHGTAPGPAFKGVEWVNAGAQALPPNVRGLAVGGVGFPGDTSGDLTRNSYGFCGAPDGSDGDGVTPIDSALLMDSGEQKRTSTTEIDEEDTNVETMVLVGVTHFPWSDVFGGDWFAPDLAKKHREERTPWYGSAKVVNQWVQWIHDS